VRNNELKSEQLERDAEDNISVNLASLSLTEWPFFFFWGRKVRIGNLEYGRNISGNLPSFFLSFYFIFLFAFQSRCRRNLRMGYTQQRGREKIES